MAVPTVEKPRVAKSRDFSSAPDKGIVDACGWAADKDDGPREGGLDSTPDRLFSTSRPRPWCSGQDLGVAMRGRRGPGHFVFLEGCVER